MTSYIHDPLYYTHVHRASSVLLLRLQIYDVLGYLPSHRRNLFALLSSISVFLYHWGVGGSDWIVRFFPTRKTIIHCALSITV